MIVLFLLRIYDSLYIYQSCGYNEIRHIKWIKKHIIRNLVFTIGSFFLLYNQLLTVIILSIYWLTIRRKKRLVFTKRILRLLLLSILFFLFIPSHIIIGFINAYTLILGLLIKPLERKIQNYYQTKALKKLSKYQGKKIAITGSYGKTSTKMYLEEYLMTTYLTLSTKQSYNTPMGISRVINEELENLYDYFIMEFGATKTGDISELNAFNPDIVVLTSIGYQHLSTFKKLDNIIKEKTKIVDENDAVAFVNLSDENIRAYKFSKKVITFGIDIGEYQAKNIDGNEFDFFHQGRFLSRVKTQIIGDQNITNVLAAVSVAHYLSVGISDIKETSKTLVNYQHRMNIKKVNDLVIIDDAFNSNIIGAVKAVRAMTQYAKNRYIITPGFVDLGEMSKECHQEFAEAIINYNCIPIIVGNQRDMIEVFKQSNYSFYKTKSFNKAYKVFNGIRKDNACLLIENDLPDCY